MGMAGDHTAAGRSAIPLPTTPRFPAKGGKGCSYRKSSVTFGCLMSQPLHILLDSETEAVIRLVEGSRWLVIYEKREQEFDAVALTEREIRGLVLEMVGRDRFTAAMAMPVDDWYLPEKVRAMVRPDVGSISIRPDVSASLDVQCSSPSITLHRSTRTIKLSIASLFLAIAAAEFLIENS